MANLPDPDRRTTIAFRLTVSNAAVLLLSVLLVAAVLVAAFNAYQNARVEKRLASQVDKLYDEVIMGKTRAGFHPALADRPEPLSVPGDEGLYVRLLSKDGEIFDGSSNFAGADSLPVQLPSDYSGIAAIDARWQSLPTRTLYAPVVRDTNLLGWIEVTAFRWDWRRSLGTRIERILLFVVLALMFAVLMGYGLARRALKPIASLTTAIEEIQVSNLNARIPVDRNVRDELTELTQTFNEMLTRVESVIERERRFTSNAAHQLLSPLTNLRNVAEVSLRRSRDAQSYEASVSTMLENIERMSATVERLLELSRIESIDQLEKEEVDLSALCTEVVERFRAQANQRGIGLESNIASNVHVQGNPVHLEQAVGNLLDNALKYTPQGGRVTVDLKKDDETVSLSVADTGIGFQPGTGERLFERFYRGEHPGVETSKGSGLGLPLVRMIVQLHGGSVTASSDGEGKGATFEVRIPG